MNGDNTPGSLHAELLEECSGHDALAGGEAVRIEEETANYGHDNNRKAATEDLGA